MEVIKLSSQWHLQATQLINPFVLIGRLLAPPLVLMVIEMDSARVAEDS